MQVTLSKKSWTISEPAIWFLVSIIILTLLVILFMLYFKKKLCFRNCGGCDSFLQPGYQKASKSLSKSYDQSGSSDSSSSDSDEENMRHLSKSIRRTASRRTIGSKSSHPGSPRTDYPSHSTDTLDGPPGSPSPGQLSRDPSLIGSASGGFDNRAVQYSPSLQEHPNRYGGVDLTVPKSISSPAGGSLHSTDWNIEADSVYRDDVIAPMETEEQEIEMAQRASAEIRDFHDDEDGEYVMEPISACGTLDVALQYSMSDRKLQVTVIEARDLPSKDRGGAAILQVRIVVLPAKKKRFKTKVQHIKAPRFGETFKLTRVSPEELRGLGLRLRLYGIGKVRDRLVGEAVLRMDELNLIRDPQLTVTLQLEPRTDVNRGDSDTQSVASGSATSSMQSLTHGGSPPELLTGLSYNPPTGRLCVEVIKGSHFRNMAMAKAPDTYVKLTLLNSACQEMAQSKTTVRRSQPNPVFKEPFYFQVALFQLSEVTLMVSVYNRKTMKRKEMIGWVSLGRNSSSENEEQHWEEMKEGKGQQVCRWHTLIES